MENNQFSNPNQQIFQKKEIVIVASKLKLFEITIKFKTILIFKNLVI